MPRIRTAVAGLAVGASNENEISASHPPRPQGMITASETAIGTQGQGGREGD
jgi:hypothetical protein